MLRVGAAATTDHDRPPVEVTGRHLPTGDPVLAPHIDDGLTIIDDQVRLLSRGQRLQPFAFQLMIRREVAGSTHPRKQLGRHVVALQPISGLDDDLVRAARPDLDADVGVHQQIHEGDDGQVGCVQMTGLEEGRPIFLDALDKVLTVVAERDRTVEVENDEFEHDTPLMLDLDSVRHIPYIRSALHNARTSSCQSRQRRTTT